MVSHKNQPGTFKAFLVGTALAKLSHTPTANFLHINALHLNLMY